MEPCNARTRTDAFVRSVSCLEGGLQPSKHTHTHNRAESMNTSVQEQDHACMSSTCRPIQLQGLRARPQGQAAGNTKACPGTNLPARQAERGGASCDPCAPDLLPVCRSCTAATRAWRTCSAVCPQPLCCPRRALPSRTPSTRPRTAWSAVSRSQRA